MPGDGRDVPVLSLPNDGYGNCHDDVAWTGGTLAPRQLAQRAGEASEPGEAAAETGVS
jgi:hypothetical protein